jgi:ADP-heptose:LPS heptosyltransferase
MVKKVFAKLIGYVHILLSIFYLLKAKYSQKAHIQNIYILCAHGAGDYLMATSAIKAIGKIHQQKEVFIIFTRSEAYLLAQLNSIHKSHNLVMLDDVVRESHQVDLLICLSGPSRDTLKLINRVKPKKIIGFIFSFMIISSFTKSTVTNYLFENHVKRNDEVVKKLSAKPDGKIHFELANTHILNLGHTAKIGLYFPYIKKQKTLPRSVLVEFAQFLVASVRYEKVCLFNYQGETDDFKDLASRIVGQPDTFSNFSWESYSDWEGLLKILFSLDKVVCTDSVVFHLCNALEIPVVGIFGPTNPNNYVPHDFKGEIVTYNVGPKYCYYGVGHNKCIKNGCADRCDFMSQILKVDLEAAILSK